MWKQLLLIFLTNQMVLAAQPPVSTSVPAKAGVGETVKKYATKNLVTCAYNVLVLNYKLASPEICERGLSSINTDQPDVGFFCLSAPFKAQYVFLNGPDAVCALVTAQ